MFWSSSANHPWHVVVWHRAVVPLPYDVPDPQDYYVIMDLKPDWLLFLSWLLYYPEKLSSEVYQEYTRHLLKKRAKVKRQTDQPTTLTTSSRGTGGNAVPRSSPHGHDQGRRFAGQDKKDKQSHHFLSSLGGCESLGMMCNEYRW